MDAFLNERRTNHLK